jgi:transposase InsO family protein
LRFKENKTQKGEMPMQVKRIATDSVRQRLFLIRLAGKIGIHQACLKLGKHRSYYYYWIDRYEAKGWRGLINHSCRPKRMPRLSRLGLVRLVCEARKQTGYGKERIHDVLKAQGKCIPVSTIGKILDRKGLLIKARRFKTQKKHTRLYNLLKPGQRVQLDIKYVPSENCPRGKRYYQYTVIDECTRMRYLSWHDSIWVEKSVEALKLAQSYFGFKIDAVQTDNGTEFTFNYTSHLQAKLKDPTEHPLDTYCRKTKISHRLIPPGEKELNGKVERSHRTDDEEFYRRIPRVNDLKELKRLGREWMHFYNRHRRHMGINKMTPFSFAQQRLKLYPNQKL